MIALALITAAAGFTHYAINDRRLDEIFRQEVSLGGFVFLPADPKPEEERIFDWSGLDARPPWAREKPEGGERVTTPGIENASLPEEFGDGYLNAEAACFLINEYRARKGAQPLDSSDERAFELAKTRLGELYLEYSSNRPDGTLYVTAYEQAGISSSLSYERRNRGLYTAEAAVLSWINSEQSRVVLLDPSVDCVAVAAGTDENGMAFWVLEVFDRQ